MESLYANESAKVVIKFGYIPFIPPPPPLFFLVMVKEKFAYEIDLDVLWLDKHAGINKLGLLFLVEEF